MKIVTILGARPQFIKAAAISRVLSSRETMSEVIVHTGQHYDDKMSEVFFREMEIPAPDHRMHVHSVGHAAMTGRMLELIGDILKVEAPDFVLVYGDTNSTLAGALAARKLGFKLAHVEAGLRSFNMAMPEEVNRVLADRISDVLFCPTEQAVQNLKQEGFESMPCAIHNVGDVMFDAAKWYSSASASNCREYALLGRPKGYALATIHRAENTDNIERLNSIVKALNKVHESTPVICPLHPRTIKALQSPGAVAPRFNIIEPVGYYDMIEFLKGSSAVLTDSGGLQKEAYFFKKPCVTMRDETEWVELVDGGFNIIAGATTDGILDAFNTMSQRHPDFNVALYGDGNAAAKICDLLEATL